MVMNLPHQVFTERLSIQRLRYEDAEEIFYGYASKDEATKFVTWPTHRSITDTKSFLRFADDAWKKGTVFSYSVRRRNDSRLLGSFGVVNDDGKLQIGYIFSPVHWGLGYATEVCFHMSQLLKQQVDVYRIQSFVDIQNTASARVLIKSGFIQEAMLPRWCRFANQNNEARDCLHFRYPF
jgi:ribosomal-protein-alanine N-acetyltransferase